MTSSSKTAKYLSLSTLLDTSIRLQDLQQSLADDIRELYGDAPMQTCSPGAALRELTPPPSTKGH